MSILELNGTFSAPGRLSLRQDRLPTGRVRSRVRALILLGGSVRSSPFVSGIGRSVLDLPIDAHHSILDLWQAHGAIHVAYSRLERLPVRVVTNCLLPAVRAESHVVAVSVERDHSELRGTGGVLRDIAENFEDHDFIAVANANQVLTESLAHLLASLEATGGDVALLAKSDGTPGGLMVARCGSLRCIARVGFIDLKEQALPQVARNHSVKVVRRSGNAALTVRTPADYIAALRHYHQGGPHVPHRNGVNVFAEAWMPVFSVCERGANVDRTARVHDSVILRGAHVDRGALVARSVVCPGAIVRRGQVVVDQLVTADAALPTTM